jgi:hypothetical protein
MTDDPAIIGEMAHMVAEGAGGPRGDSPLTSEERDRYDNLILLCRHHHREVDAQPGTWPVDRLKKLKVEHEAWVTQNLPGYDAQKLRDDEILATYIDQWVNRAHLKDWQRSMQSVFADGQPSLEIEVVGDLNELPSWIHTRVWPDRYPTIKIALQNFARVLRDFISAFQEHAAKPYADATFQQTEKFYRLNEWDEPRYRLLSKQFDHHVDLVQDLGLELTRAGNLVCDEVRANFLPSFFLEEGRLSILSGPHEDMTWKRRVVQYSAEEKASTRPYPGLDQFLTD